MFQPTFTAVYHVTSSEFSTGETEKPKPFPWGNISNGQRCVDKASPSCLSKVHRIKKGVAGGQREAVTSSVWISGEVSQKWTYSEVGLKE